MAARPFLPLFAVAVLLAFTTCDKSPTSASPDGLSPIFARKCDTPPCGKGPGDGGAGLVAQELEGLGGNRSYAYDMNRRGQIVG
jgi:hypothetical protein